MSYTERSGDPKDAVTVLRQEIDETRRAYREACERARVQVELCMAFLDRDLEDALPASPYIYRPDDFMAEVHWYRSRVGYLRQLLARELERQQS